MRYLDPVECSPLTASTVSQVFGMTRQGVEPSHPAFVTRAP